MCHQSLWGLWKMALQKILKGSHTVSQCVTASFSDWSNISWSSTKNFLLHVSYCAFYCGYIWSRSSQTIGWTLATVGSLYIRILRMIFNISILVHWVLTDGLVLYTILCWNIAKLLEFSKLFTVTKMVVLGEPGIYSWTAVKTDTCIFSALLPKEGYFLVINQLF